MRVTGAAVYPFFEALAALPTLDAVRTLRATEHPLCTRYCAPELCTRLAGDSPGSVLAQETALYPDSTDA
jgi:hypothetical protein